MRQVAMALHTPNGGWKDVGSVAEIEPPGTLSSSDPAGRQVYLFGWHHDVPGVWRARGGIDVENEAVREVVTTGFDQLSDLRCPYELDVVRSGGVSARLRFTLHDD